MCLCVYSRVGASCVGRPICVCAVLAPLRRVNTYNRCKHRQESACRTEDATADATAEVRARKQGDKTSDIIQTNSRADFTLTLTQQMIGCIKATTAGPLREEPASAKLFLDFCTPCWRRVARSARWGQPHRSSALDGAAAALTVARTRGVAMPLSWCWSHLPQGRA